MKGLRILLTQINGRLRWHYSNVEFNRERIRKEFHSDDHSIGDPRLFNELMKRIFHDIFIQWNFHHQLLLLFYQSLSQLIPFIHTNRRKIKHKHSMHKYCFANSFISNDLDTTDGNISTKHRTSSID